MQTSLIEQLQFTTNLDERQAQTYLTLFELGEMRIGPLAEALQLHKQIVYNTLAQLEEKGFVVKKERRGTQHFQAVNPEYMLQQKQKEMVQLEHLVPQLQLMEGVKQYVADIQVYGGVTAFHRFHEQQLKRMPRESTLDVLGAGGDDFLAIMNQRYFFRLYENIRIDRELRHRLLMYADQKDVDSLYIHRKFVEARFLPQALKQSPMATQIWPDSVSLVMFGEDPQIVHIRSQKIREGFAGHFRSLWAMAEEAK
jgi:predicted transcriptional regulator